MSHIVLVSRIYAPEPAAASFRLEAMVNALIEAGHDVTVLTTAPRPGSTLASPASPEGAGSARKPGGRLRIKRAPVLRNRDGYVRGYVQYMSFDVPAALRLLLVRRPDVVVVEPPPTTGVVVRAIAALRRVPYVYYAADLWSDAVVSDAGPGLVSRVLAHVEGWAMRGAHGVIAVLPSVADRVRDLTGRPVSGPRAQDVQVVGHGIDTRVFHPARESEPQSRPAGAPANFMVYTGTTSSWHGAEIFLRALPRVREQTPDLELVFLGHGAQWEDLQALAAELTPGAVHFHPVLPPAEAARWLRAATGAIVSLKPGQNYNLAFPTKLYAAVACGIPVVFAGVGPAEPVVRDNALGFAVPYDVDAVAEAMIALVRDADSVKPEWSPTRLVDWVRANASLDQVGAQGAALVADWAQR